MKLHLTPELKDLIVNQKYDEFFNTVMKLDKVETTLVVREAYFLVFELGRRGGDIGSHLSWIEFYEKNREFYNTPGWQEIKMEHQKLVNKVRSGRK